MFLKTSIFLGMMVALTYAASATPGHQHIEPDNQWVTETCKYNNVTGPNLDACLTTVAKCLFTPDTEKANTAFCTCKDQVTGLGDIYKTWVSSKHGGQDLCADVAHGGSFPSHHSGHSDNFHISFNKYIEHTYASQYAALECCDGEAQGLYDNGVVVVSAWKANADSITDPDGKKAVIASIDSCAIHEKLCSPHEFMHCVMDGCYHTLSNTNPNH